VVTASTIHMSIVGPQGLENTASACHANTNDLIEKLCAIDGVEQRFTGIGFHEAVLKLDADVADVLKALMNKNILGGYDLSSDYPELGNAMLVCATEMRSQDDINAYASALTEIMAAQTTKVAEAV